MSNNNKNYKIAFIFVLYKTPNKEVKRLKEEVKALGILDYRIYFIDNTKNNRGYAAGVNIGLKQAIKDGCNLFVVANPDISLKNLNGKNLLAAGEYFDIWGLAMRQAGKIYYGGKIDRWRLSGGLIDKKPEKRFFPVDFVSGSLMFIKKKVIEKVGPPACGFDEGYFMYYEDVDFCFRAKKEGFGIGVDTKNFYKHKESSKSNKQKEYFLFKNRWRFFWRYSNLSQKIKEFIRLPKTFFESLPLFLKLFLESKFLRDFFSLNFSTFLNKLFHFGLFIFLVKNLLPAQYGLYTLAWAYVGFFIPFIDLGTTNYGLVYLPKQSRQALIKLIFLRLFIALIIYCVANIAAFFIFLRQKEMFWYVFLASSTIISSIWSGSYLIINSIRQKVIYSSLLSLVFNLFFVALIMIFYLLFKNLSAIFQAVFISFFLYFLLNYFLVKKEIGRWQWQMDFSFWTEIIKKSLIFVLISFFASVRYKADVFLLNFFQGSEAVGLYSSGYKFLEASVLIAGSYNITAMPIFSKLSKDLNALRKKIKKDYYLLMFLSLSIVFGFYFLSPLILPILLGERYLASIYLARLLIFALPFIFINSIFFNFLYSQDRPQKVLFVLIIQAFLSLILNLVFIPKISYWSPVYVSILGEIITVLLSFKFIHPIIKK